MAVLAELFVKIGADASKFKAGLSDADSRMGKFSKSIMKHHRAIGVAMTAIGGAIIAVGVMSVKTYAQMGDAVHKMALRTGFSTEALSELRHAADLSGASLEGIEKGSRTLSGAITDAGFGLETYVRAFESIGLAYEDLAKLSPEEQFLTVLEALAKVEDQTLRAAIAADIMGRSGTAMLPMLAQGAEGLAAMRQEAHELGIVFDQEAANKAAEFTDALTKLDGAVNGVKKVIAEALMPILLPLIEKIKETTANVSAWMKEHPELAKVIVIVTGAIGGLLLVLGPLMIFLPGIIQALPILAGAFAALTGPIGLVVLAVGALIAAGIALWQNWDKVVHFFKRAWINIKIYFLTGIEKILSALRKFTDFLPWLGDKIEAAHNSIRDMIDSEEVKRDALILQRELTLSTEAMDTATEAAKEMETALASVGETTKEVDNILKTHTATLEGVTAATTITAGAVGGVNGLPAHIPRPTGGTPAMSWLPPRAWTEDISPGTTYAMAFESLIWNITHGAKISAGRAHEFKPILSPELFTALYTFLRARDVMAGAPTLHGGGSVLETGIAKVRKGETILEGGAGMNLTINFTEPVFMEREESITKLADRIYRKIKQEQRFSFGEARG